MNSLFLVCPQNMANISMTNTHRTEGFFWLKLSLLLANWRVLYKHLLIWIHKPNGGGKACRAGCYGNYHFTHVPASQQWWLRTEMQSLPVATNYILTLFTFLIENSWFPPPILCESKLYYGRTFFFHLFRYFSWGIFQTEVISNQFWLSSIKEILLKVQLSAMCWGWYERNLGPILFFKELIAGVKEHRHKVADKQHKKQYVVKCQTLQHRGL